MPLHFESFVSKKNKKAETDLFANLLTFYTQNCDKVLTSSDKTKILSTSYLKDINTKKIIGKIVITLIVKEQSLEIVDADIVLIDSKKVKLNFIKKLDDSSESNEYYAVKEIKDNKCFNIETVNRYLIDENIENTTKKVSLSAFPFALNIYETEKEMNESLGLGKEIEVFSLGKKFITIDNKMMADGSIVGKTEEPCSFVLGQVKDFKDVEIDLSGNIIKFKIIYLDTGVGIMPVAANEDNFDLSKLKKNTFISMVANIKADFAK